MNDGAKGEMDPDTPDGGDRFLDLSNDLRAAVLWVKQRPVSQAALQRALDGALKLPAAIKSAPAVKAPSDRSRVGKLVPWMMAAAMCLTIAAWFFRPADLWAEVLQNTQKQPWIHATIRVSQSDQVQEFWHSTSRGQSASRSKEQILVVDRALRTMDRYEPQEKILYRFPVTADDLIQQDQLLGLFEGLFRGEVKPGVGFRGTVLKEQKRRQIDKGGQKWDEFKLQWHSPPPGGPEVQMTFYVDPQTHLPQSMTGKFGMESAEFTFDYPENGPGDIYALGVPKDAKLVDRVPKGDMARILAGIKAGHDRFDDYQGMIVEDCLPGLTPGKGQKMNRVFLVWKKGKKWRVECGYCTALQASSIPAGKGKKEWVREAFKKTEFETMNICDGRSVYLGERRDKDNKRDQFEYVGTIEEGYYLFGQASAVMPENWSYPSLRFPQPTRWTTEEVTVAPSEGPPNTILVTSRFVEPTVHGNGFYRFWIDPKKGYALKQSEYLATDSALKPPTGSDNRQILENWEQTPSGIWYATQAGGGSIKENPGDRWIWHHCFLDFNTDLPDDLFKRERRKVFADIYPVGP